MAPQRWSSGAKLMNWTLAIDTGSTFSRAAFSGPILNPVGVDIHRSATYLANKKHSQYELPSVGRPHHPPYNVGTESYEEPGCVSLKWFYYILADETRGLEPVLRHLGILGMDKNRLEEMLVKYYRILKKHIDASAESNRVGYTEMCLSIPSTYSQKIQQIYVRIIQQVWTKIPSHSIVLMTETECLAHFMLHRNFSALQGKTCVLFVDLGGHSMGACVYQLNWDGKHVAFFEKGSPFGRNGGGEVWDALVGEQISRQLAGRDRSGEIMAKFVKQFHNTKSQLPADNQEDMVFSDPDAGIDVVITAEEIECSYNKAFRPIYDMIEERILELPPDAVVCFSGGSLWGHQAQQDTRNLVTEHGLKPVVACTEARMNDTLVVTKGAVSAQVQNITVKSFLDRGAAIGVQMDGINAAEITFQSGAPTETQTCTIDLPRRTKLRLICDPLRRLRESSGQLEGHVPGFVPVSHSYDFWTIGERKAGTYEFALHWEPEGRRRGDARRGGGSFRLEETRVKEAKKKRRKVCHTNRLQLYIDGGHNCIHVDLETSELDPPAWAV